MSSLSLPLIKHTTEPFDPAVLLPGVDFFDCHVQQILELQPQLVILASDRAADLDQAISLLKELAIPALIFCQEEVSGDGLIVSVKPPWTRERALTGLVALTMGGAGQARQFSRLAESLEDVAYTLDTELRHNGVFGRWLEASKLKQEDFLGRTHRQLLGDKEGEPHEEAALKALKGESVEYLWSMRTKGRKLAWYQTRVSPLYDGLGRITGVVGVGRDITELRDTNDRLSKSIRQAERLAKDLEKATQAANRADRAKTEFMAAVSHEFRVHLNQLVGLGDLLAESDLAEKPRLYADMLNSSVAALVKLNNDIHHMSRLELGSTSLRIEDFSLVQVLGQVQALLASKLNQAGLKLQSNIDSQVPIYITGDVDCLQQVLLNLISEAISADSGSITLDITRVPTPIGGTLTLLFAIKAEGHKRTEMESLNLVLARRTVELLGGNLWAETAKGSFVLNVALQFNLPADQVVREAGGRGEHSLSVLLVEDFADNVTLIKAFLASSSHQLVTAEDGQAGVELYKQGSYDVILMDMQMPVMDGFTATREIRRWEESQGLGPVPIIALTAYAFPEDVDRALKAGCNAHLAKPVTKAALLAAINNWIAAK